MYFFSSFPTKTVIKGYHMNVKLILLFSYFLLISACNSQEENESTITVQKSSVSLVSLRVLDLIFTSTENRAFQFHDHVFSTGAKDLIFKNNQDTTKVFSFNLNYDELLQFETELPNGNYDLHFEFEAENVSNFLPFRVNISDISLTGTEKRIDIAPYTTYSLVRIDTSFLNADMPPFLESNKFGKKELILHPNGDHYYLYIDASNEEIRLNFKENIFDTELFETLVVESRYLYKKALTSLPIGPSSERFSRRIKGSLNPGIGFWEYLPAGYGLGNKWPLILYFHGLGDNGNGSSDLYRVLYTGLPNLISEDKWPITATASNAASTAGDAFVVLSMQNDSGCPTADKVNDFMRWAINEYDIDITRIYLSGYSCGGGGVWNYIGKYISDDLVAAAVPVAALMGEYIWNRLGCNIGMLPIWAFHGDKDNVTVRNANIPIDGLNNCANECSQVVYPENCLAPVDARKTIFREWGHNIWPITYKLDSRWGHDIYAWMLSHVNGDAKL